MASPIITTTATAGQRRALSVLVYGAAGAGKTYLARTTRDVDHTLILAAEPGLLSLRDVSIPVAEVGTVALFDSAHQWLRAGSHDYRWVILDSLTEVADLILTEELASATDPRQAYGAVIDRITSLVRDLRQLRCHIVMICGEARIQDDAGRLLYGPRLPGRQLGQVIPYLVDEVLALVVDRVPGSDTVQRWLQCHPDGRYQAKDRSGALHPREPADLATIAARAFPGQGVTQ